MFFRISFQREVFRGNSIERFWKSIIGSPASSILDDYHYMISLIWFEIDHL